MRLIKILIPMVLVFFLVACKVEKPTQQSSIIVNNQTVQEAKPAPIPPPQVKCHGDSDCGGRLVVGTPNCFQGNVQGTVRIAKCVNPDTVNSYCTYDTSTGIIQECPKTQFCRQGECLDYQCTDSDGGLNFDQKGTVTVNDGNVYDDYCKDSNTLIEYYCSSDNRAFTKVNVCSCESGACTS